MKVHTKRRGRGYATMAATAAAMVLSGLGAAPAAASAPSSAALASAAPAATALAPTAAQSWSALMARSLGSGPEAIRLKTLLAGLQTAFPVRVAALSAARQQQISTQAALTAATTADTPVQAASATAKAALTDAQAKLAAALKKRPASKTRIARARAAVKTAAATAQERGASAAASAATLRTVQANAQSATDALTAATAAWQSTNVGIRNTQQKIIALPAFDAATAAQAAAISQSVVTEIRAKFTVADTTQVYGITVNKAVAYAFGRLIDDAAKDGILLSGGGFRTRQQQIQLRVTNGCPDIWTAPASSCKVPTAIPGRSLHEIGLAVDITTGGSTIKDRTSPAFTWLAAHAARYGYVNLPSEPWHWSITGN